MLESFSFVGELGFSSRVRTWTADDHDHWRHQENLISSENDSLPELPNGCLLVTLDVSSL